MQSAPKFDCQINAEFSRELRKRVQFYFKENNISQRANTRMVLRSIALTTLWIGSYLILVLAKPALPVAYLLWAILGFSNALVCVNIGHDAIHGAYTKRKWLKNILVQSFNLNGASAYMWKISHNHAHHTYTNVHGHDEDINPGDFMRISPSAKLLSFHKYQHIYAFFIYSLATLSWVFAKDYIQFFQNKIHNYDNHKHPVSEYFFLFFYKLLNYSIFLVLPLMVLPYGWGHIVGGFVIMHLIAGFYLAIIFMLAHAVEEVQFPLPDEDGMINDDWVVHQLQTTANFAADSSLAGLLTGGLNTQIEHHLFANICSIHYRPLSKIVAQTCKDFQIPYFNLPTFGQAIKSHYRFLKKIGTEQDYQPKPAPKMEAVMA